jgi:hypothetical protein
MKLMFRNTLLAAAAALTLSTGAAFAQSAQPADIGSFIYNQDGVAIGSLDAIQGNQATVHLGFFNTPGNHLVTVPASELASQGGQLVLNGSGASQVATR